MNWKNWPYWVKGGIIGAIVMILIIGVDYVGACYGGTKQEFCGYFTIMASLPLAFLLLGKLTAFEIFSTKVSITEYMVSAVILYFILGAFIGFLYGKYKSRKQFNTGSPPTRG